MDVLVVDLGLRGGSGRHRRAPAASARGSSAIYWPLIYPGSAFLRRMRLDATRRRVEYASPDTTPAPGER